MLFRPAFFIAAIALLVSPSLAAEPETAHIVLLHVNDVHGQTRGYNQDGKVVGGYARLASAVEQIRQEVGRENVLLIHAGDEFSRGDAMTIATAGASSIALMNQIGFSVFVPGNGEFYGGAANLQHRIAEAKFPVLASNVTYRLDGKPLSQDRHIANVGPVRVGMFGLCFLRKEHHSSLPLKVEDPAEAARREARKLREENVDLVVAVTHIGLPEDRQVAQSVEGIDVIVGGQSHATLPRGNWVTAPDERPVLIVHAGDYLRYLGRVDLHLVKLPEGWSLTDASATLIPLDQSIPEDPAIKAAIARMWPRKKTTQSTTQAAQGK